MYLNLQQLVDSFELRCESVYAKIYDGERYLSVPYSKLYQTSKSVASFFQQKGLKKGDRIVLISENRPEWVMSYLGIVYNGLVAVPLDAMLHVEDIREFIKESNTSIMMTSIGIFEKIKDDKEIMSLIKEWILFDKVSSSQDNIVYLDQIYQQYHQSEISKEIIKQKDLASLIFTSGTTGKSKAVMLSHGNFIHQVNNLQIAAKLTSTDVIFSVLPLHHTFQFSVEMAVLGSGGSMSYADSIKPNRLIDCIKSTKVTVMIGIPTLYAKILDGIMRQLHQLKSPVKQILFALYNFSAFMHSVTGSTAVGQKLFGFLRKKAGFETVRFLISGAAPLSYSVAKAYAALGFNLANGYGLTEASPVISVGDCEGFIDNKSVGEIIPNLECKILDANDQGVGQICVRGNSVMQGYFNNPEATSEVITTDSWLKTGDMGYLKTVKGKTLLYITGRYKNIIVTGGGKNVYPEEIEELINEHEYILESIAIGVPVSEDDMSETVCALIVMDVLKLEEKGISKDLAQTEIANHIKQVNAKLQMYQVIRGYEILEEELIKNSTRKIKRFEYKGKNYQHLLHK